MLSWPKPLNMSRKKYDSANLSISGKAQKTRDADNSRFAPLADVRERWSEFDVESIAAHPSIAASLSTPCAVRWEPLVARFARVVYSERQLEALFLQTLMIRVNIALDKAIPPNEERIAILDGPGAFESVSAEASVQRLLPDWIVVQGNFDVSMNANVLPVLKDVATEGRILAVGDTKLVRQWGGSGSVSYTKACHHDSLAPTARILSQFIHAFRFHSLQRGSSGGASHGRTGGKPQLVGQRCKPSSDPQLPRH
ncbi:hypothetical protein V8C34DRAFT_200282 [Trichoderma compactum]